MSKGAKLPVCFDCKFNNLNFPCRSEGILDEGLIATSFLEQYRASHGPNPDAERAESLYWAYDCLSELTQNAPDSAFDVIVEALGRA